MADDQQLAALRAGKEAFRRYIGDNSRDKVDLAGADLRGCDIEGLNLQGANLEGANLAGCSLRGARLNSSNLRGANLRGCDLSETGMHRADLTGADLRGTTGARFGSGDSRLCVAPASFDGVHWDRAALAAMLELMNLNPDWEIRYEIVPRGGSPASAHT